VNTGLTQKQAELLYDVYRGRHPDAELKDLLWLSSNDYVEWSPDDKAVVVTRKGKYELRKTGHVQSRT
jgi:hypothetical protein